MAAESGVAEVTVAQNGAVLLECPAFDNSAIFQGCATATVSGRPLTGHGEHEPAWVARGGVTRKSQLGETGDSGTGRQEG